METLGWHMRIPAASSCRKNRTCTNCWSMSVACAPDRLCHTIMDSMMTLNMLMAVL